MRRPESSSSRTDVAPWHDVRKLLRDDRWTEAVALLRLLAAETNCPAVRLTLGALLAERGNYCEAIRLWTSVIDDARHCDDRSLLAAAYRNLAAVYRLVEDFDLSRRFEKQAQRLDDGSRAEVLQCWQVDCRWALERLDPRRN